MKKSVILLLILAFLLISSNALFAEVQETHPDQCLYYYFNRITETYLPGSTADPEQEVLTAEFWMLFSSPDSLPDPSLNPMMKFVKIQFTFDNTKWEITPQDIELIGDAVGAFGEPYVEIVDDHILVELTGTGLAPFYQGKGLVAFNFKPLCQEAGVSSPLTFDEAGSSNMVLVDHDNGSESYHADPRWDGAIDIDYNLHEYTIASGVDGTLGSEVTVPVQLESNLRIFSMHHFIDYDPNVLEFVDVEPNLTYFTDPCSECIENDDGNGLLEIYLVNECGTWPDCYIEPFPTPDDVYFLKFRVIGNSTNTTIPISFVEHLSFDSSYNDYRAAGSPCEVFDESINPPQMHDGSIHIPPYMTEIKSECVNPYLEYNGGFNYDVDFAISLLNNYPAGDYSDQSINGAIDFLFEMPGFLDPNYVADPLPSDLNFVGREYINGSNWLHVTQEFVAGLSNHWGPSVNMTNVATVNFDFEPMSYVPDYENRTYALEFGDSYDDYGDMLYTRVEDTTGTVTHYKDDIACTAVPVTVKMGEFFTRFASDGDNTVTQKLWLRGNFDVGQFSVNVTVSGDLKFSSVYPAPNVTATKIDNYEYQIHFDGASFASATEDDSVLVATMNFSGACLSQGWKMVAKDTPDGGWYLNATTSFSQAFIKDNVGDEHFVDLSPGNLRGWCDDPIQLPPPNQEYKSSGIPTEFALDQNHPNPFNPTTTISYDVPNACQVRIVVMNILGQQVATLVDETKAPGHYEVIWYGTDDNGSKVSSGIYLYSIQTGDFVQTRKMMLMK